MKTNARERSPSGARDDAPSPSRQPRTHKAKAPRAVQKPAVRGQLTLLNHEAMSLPLTGYLACALTGLDPASKQTISMVSHEVARICAEHGVDLYEPRTKTDPDNNKEIPDAEVWALDREKVVNSDLLIHLCQVPSTGSGQELEIAYNGLVPMILISHSSRTVSRMVTGIPSLKYHIEYTEPEELDDELHTLLSRIRPVLEERKLAFTDFDTNIVGASVRRFRSERGMSLETLAEAVQLSPASLSALEESTDRTANCSLLQLRRIASVLGTTVAELVEPDSTGRMISVLEDWVGHRAAARRGSLTDQDRSVLVRRTLQRVIDSLDNTDGTNAPS